MVERKAVLVDALVAPEAESAVEGREVVAYEVQVQVLGWTGVIRADAVAWTVVVAMGEKPVAVVAVI